MDLTLCAIRVVNATPVLRSLQCRPENERSQVGKLEKLIEEEMVDVNIVDSVNHYSSLMLASWHGLADIVRLLLSNGADPNVKSSSNWTALMAAMRFENEKAVEIAEMLLESGANVNDVDEDGISALMMTAQHPECQSLEMTYLLVNWGADVNAKDAQGWSPLFWTIFSSEFDLLDCYQYRRVLLNSGTDVNAVDNAGWTPLMWAIDKSDIGIIKQLVTFNNDIDINRKNYQEESAITIAILLENEEIVSLLLQTFRVNLEERYGDFEHTALMIACAKNKASGIAETLIMYGSDVNAVNGSKWSALILAASQENVAMAKVLILAGADTSLCHYLPWCFSFMRFNGLVHVRPEERDLLVIPRDRQKLSKFDLISQQLNNGPTVDRFTFNFLLSISSTILCYQWLLLPSLFIQNQ